MKIETTHFWNSNYDWVIIPSLMIGFRKYGIGIGFLFLKIKLELKIWY